MSESPTNTRGRRRLLRPEDRRTRRPRQGPPLAPDEALEPDDPLQAIIELTEVLPDLSRRDQTFARSLLIAYFDLLRLSHRQWYWIQVLKGRAQGERPPTVEGGAKSG